jgi:hypothetical protein
VPLADLHETLAQMQSGYAIQEDSKPASADGKLLLHVVATRKSPGAKGPPTVEIWADPQSRVPVRIVFDQAKFQGSAEPRRLTFELLNQTALPPDWFTVGSHIGK